jgi:hypothetical protein
MGPPTDTKKLTEARTELMKQIQKRRQELMTDLKKQQERLNHTQQK